MHINKHIHTPASALRRCQRSHARARAYAQTIIRLTILLESALRRVSPDAEFQEGRPFHSCSCMIFISEYEHLPGFPGPLWIAIDKYRSLAALSQSDGAGEQESLGFAPIPHPTLSVRRLSRCRPHEFGPWPNWISVRYGRRRRRMGGSSRKFAACRKHSGVHDEALKVGCQRHQQFDANNQ